MTSTTRSRISVGVMTRIAILAAAASILFLIEIPVVAFYKLDLSNIPVLLGAFSMDQERHRPAAFLQRRRRRTGGLHYGRGSGDSGFADLSPEQDP